MARPQKIGLAYYNSDTDRYQDLKIKRLKKAFGCTGIAVYDYVLNEIYRVHGCFLEWDENTAFDVSEYFNIKESDVIEVIKYCCSVQIFDKKLFKEQGVLTSRAVQSRYIFICKNAKRKNYKVPEHIKLIQEETKLITEETKLTTEESVGKRGKSTQRKEKKSKVKKSKEEESAFHPQKNVFYPVASLAEKYLSDRQTLQAVMNGEKITEPQIRQKMQAFVQHLTTLGQHAKEREDFNKHFLYWIRKNNSQTTSYFVDIG